VIGCSWCDPVSLLAHGAGDEEEEEEEEEEEAPAVCCGWLRKSKPPSGSLLRRTHLPAGTGAGAGGGGVLRCLVTRERGRGRLFEELLLVVGGMAGWGCL